MMLVSGYEFLSGELQPWRRAWRQMPEPARHSPASGATGTCMVQPMYASEVRQAGTSSIGWPSEVCSAGHCGVCKMWQGVALSINLASHRTDKLPLTPRAGVPPNHMPCPQGLPVALIRLCQTLVLEAGMSSQTILRRSCQACPSCGYRSSCGPGTSSASKAARDGDVLLPGTFQHTCPRDYNRRALCVRWKGCGPPRGKTTSEIR